MIGVISELLSRQHLEANAPSIRNEAHRKVAIAEWLLRMETRRVFKEEEQDADQDQLIIRLGAMSEFVDYRKEELESLPSLMNVMSPPPSSPPDSQFDHYLELPGPVVREKIISFVSDPQDKLNLLEAYPKDEKFFKPTRAQLQFELDFPRWIAEGRLSWIDDHDRLHQLAGISDHHRKVILEHFENYLVNDITNARERMDSHHFEVDVNGIFYSENEEDENENEQMEEMIDAEEVVNRPRPQLPVDLPRRLRPPVNLSKLPITLRVKLNGSLLQNLSWFIKRGEAIWNFHLYYNRREDWDSFCDYLETVPNLRSLYFQDSEGPFTLRDDEDEEMVNGPWEGNLELSLLPELPYLKAMQLCGDDKPSFFQVSHRLLEKYGEQLNKLSFTIHRFPEFGFPPCPNVTILSFTALTQEPDDEPRNCEMVLQFLSNFENAPLKVLKVKIREIRGRYVMHRMLEFISLKFGGTLEHLELEFRYHLGSEFTTGNESAPSSWNVLDAIYLPKLKHFGTNVNPSQDGWRYLLLIPSLETLTVDKSDGWKWASFKEDDEKIGMSEQSIRRFKLWKWLPRLQTIQVVKPFKDFRYQGTITVTVSREQAFLQN